MAEVKKKKPSKPEDEAHGDRDQDYVNDTLKAGFLPEGVVDQLKKSSS